MHYRNLNFECRGWSGIWFKEALSVQVHMGYHNWLCWAWFWSTTSTIIVATNASSKFQLFSVLSSFTLWSFHSCTSLSTATVLQCCALGRWYTGLRKNTRGWLGIGSLHWRLAWRRSRIGFCSLSTYIVEMSLFATDFASIFKCWAILSTKSFAWVRCLTTSSTWAYLCFW